MAREIYTFEVTNLETLQIFRFVQSVKQKTRLPLIGELQKRVCVYLFENRLVPEVSEISVRINPECDHIEMKIIGGGEKLFVKIGVFK